MISYVLLLTGRLKNGSVHQSIAADSLMANGGGVVDIGSPSYKVFLKH